MGQPIRLHARTGVPPAGDSTVTARGGSEGPRERIRVSTVALALYDAGTEADADALLGFLPHTESNPAGRGRTRTVDGWLSAVESAAGSFASRRDQSVRMEGHR